MATKILLLVMSGILLLGCTDDKAVGPDREQQILESTLMITMTVPELEAAPEVDEALSIPPDEYQTIAWPGSYVVAEGLGTLVNKGGELLIITHDHWSVLNGNLGIVRIRNGHNQILAELRLWQFKRLIKHRDGGTMVLSAPEEIAAKFDPDQLKSLGHSNLHVVAGDQVSLVYRQRDGQAGFAAMQAKVESIGRMQGLPVLKLSTPEGLPVIPGDSGGGIWLDGELVANTWVTIMMYNTQTGDTRPAGSSIAALIGFGEGLVDSASAIDLA